MKKFISLILVLIMTLSIFASVNASAASAPATPTTKAISGLQGVNVSWNEITGSTKYNIYRRQAGSSEWILIGVTATTSFVDKSAKNAIYYCYSVRAYNANGSYSAYVSSKTSLVRYILAPYTLTEFAISGIQIKWGAIGGATKYSVFRRDAGSNVWNCIGTTTGTSILDQNVKAGSYYCYSVRAINGTGFSAYNANKTKVAQFVVAPYVNATCLNNGIQLTWSKVYGGVEYSVFRRNAGSTQWRYLTTTTGTSLVDMDVVRNQYYAYSVRAINKTGYSAYNAKKNISIKFDTSVDNTARFTKYAGLHKNHFYKEFPFVEELGGWIGSNWAACQGNVILGYNPTKNTCNAVMVDIKTLYPNIFPSSGICTNQQLSLYLNGRTIYERNVGEGDEFSDEIKKIYTVPHKDAEIVILCSSYHGFDVDKDIALVIFKNQ